MASPRTQRGPRVLKSPLPVAGGPHCGHKGIQPLVRRPGGAAAPRAPPPPRPEPDHGLPGDPDPGPGPGQL